MGYLGRVRLEPGSDVIQERADFAPCEPPLAQLAALPVAPPDGRHGGTAHRWAKGKTLETLAECHLKPPPFVFSIVGIDNAPF